MPMLDLSLKSTALESCFDRMARQLLEEVVLQVYRSLLYLGLLRQNNDVWKELGITERIKIRYGTNYAGGKMIEAANLFKRTNTTSTICQWLGYYHQHHSEG